MHAYKTYSSLIKRNLSAIFNFVHLSFIQAANVLTQIILIPVITRIVGLSSFGQIMVATSYAALVSILINYGSNQSGVKDIALYKDQPSKRSAIFYSIYFVRIVLFLLSILSLFLLKQTGVITAMYDHLLFANMLILSETLNPFFFFVGLQKLFLYNIVTLITRTLAILLVILFVHTPEDSIWVNFLLGLSSSVGYLFLCIFLISRFRLTDYKVSASFLKKYVQQNFYLTGNNICVQLQQSFFLFTVSAMDNPLLLGAYSLCDKFVWSFRMLIISFFNVVYPRASIVYNENPTAWMQLRKKLSSMLWVVFLTIALLLILFADQLVWLVTGTSNPLSASFIQAICIVPLIAALNSLNVTDLLLRNRYQAIFKIALILLALSVIISLLLTQWGDTSLFGFFPALTEIFSIPLYLYFIRQSGVPAVSKAE